VRHSVRSAARPGLQSVDYIAASTPEPGGAGCWWQSRLRSRDCSGSALPAEPAGQWEPSLLADDEIRANVARLAKIYAEHDPVAEIEHLTVG
jgi:hypothetical protein